MKAAKKSVQPRTMLSDDFREDGTFSPKQFAAFVAGPADVAAQEVVDTVGAMMIWRDDDCISDVVERLEGGNRYDLLVEMIGAAVPMDNTAQALILAVSDAIDIRMMSSYALGVAVGRRLAGGSFGGAR